ncbi:thiol-disulfide oxidoreductase DCC family protein [Cerasicoccus arenae]|uniref:DUF393 domain-containing protein n=1 Tax=Cerasicoccus arenae TaxID=424488 RepID=A0A8J3DKI3_9BACT|nr:DUF393 domain-containing protein [Cerasicoccus arenae]MBK1858473.1 DUF393 domain-containing protein [Cerasicoccus arenae]GHC10436.1 hypothetical protein GCM10007047_29730 [Cerasicoccus arenae]
MDTQPKIDELTVFFDADCQICRRAHRWIARQPKFVRIKFLPLQTENLVERFPGIDQFDLREELTVLGPQGQIWQGLDGWLMVLWALEVWRGRAIEFAQPHWRPLARRLIVELSNNRYRLSSLLSNGDEDDLREVLAQPAPSCAQDNCELKVNP